MRRTPRATAHSAAPMAILVLATSMAHTACKRQEAPAPAQSAAPPAAAPVSSDVAPKAPVASAAPAPSASVTPEPPAPIGAPKQAGDVWKRPPTAGDRHAGKRGPIADEKDAEWLERLATGVISRVTRNTGGSSITLKVRFSDGRRAALKPEQEHWRVGHRAEIAAYQLDRVLGFNRTAPVAGRRILLPELRRHVEADDTDAKWLERFDRDVRSRDGYVDVALIAWHEKSLGRAEPPRDWTDGLASAEGGRPELAARLPEWSDLVVFDFLIDNTDRWSGGNVLTLGPGGPLIFLDNAAGFSPWRKGATTRERVDPVCRFRAATVEAVRARTTAAPENGLAATLARSLAHDALSPVLNKTQLADLDSRAQWFVEHVDRCIEKLGEATVLSL